MPVKDSLEIISQFSSSSTVAVPSTTSDVPPFRSSSPFNSIVAPGIPVPVMTGDAPSRSDGVIVRPAPTGTTCK